MDPLQQLLGALWSTPIIFPTQFAHIAPIINTMFVLMVWSLFRPNLAGSEDQREEKKMTKVYGSLIERIDELIPLYASTNQDYIKARFGDLTKNKNVVQLVCPISKRIKLRAEKDFCLHDADRPNDLMALQMQLQSLLEGNHG